MEEKEVNEKHCIVRNLFMFYVPMFIVKASINRSIKIFIKLHAFVLEVNGEKFCEGMKVLWRVEGENLIEFRGEGEMVIFMH